MAATNFTPISLYYSTTASAVPTSGNLANGELGLNIADMKLYAKNSAGVVTLLASNAGASGSVTSVAATVPAFLSIAGSPITTSGTLAITLSGTALPIANGGTGTTSTTFANLTTNVTGTLPVANGGTGVTTSTGTGSTVLSASPTFTGTPLSTTAALNTNTTQIATTAFVVSQIGAIAAGVSSFSAGTTGFTPSTATTGAVTLAGTLATTNGGTGLTSFTSGGVVYASSSSALATGSGLTFDGTNLDVAGRLLLTTTTSPNAQGQWGYNATGGTYIFSKAGSTQDFILYRSDGNSGLELTAAGNIGIGVTPSAWYVAANSYRGLQVGFGGVIYGRATSNQTGLASNFFAGTSGADTYINNGHATTYQQISGEHQWYNAPSGTAGNPLTFTQAMTLTAAGSLGVGATGPNAKLEVSIATLTSGTVALFTSPSYESVRIFAGLSNGIGTLSTSPFGLSTNSTVRFQIGGSGQFGIGASPDYGLSGQVLTSGGSGAAPTWATAGGGGFSSMDVFTSSGTWTVPTGITKCKVTVTGAGGGVDNNQCGGGGAGGTAISYLTVSGGSATITIGAGTTGAGGNSTFVYSATTLTGNGGGAGSDFNSVGGTGGSASGGTMNIEGGGGMGANVAGGVGGSSFWGGGGHTSRNAEGAAGQAYGSGAGGRSSSGSPTTYSGKSGVITIEY